MRFHLVVCCLLIAFSLTAQSNTEKNSGWEISAVFSPDLRKRTQLTGVRSERLPLDGIPIAQRPRDLRSDTLFINGQQRIFGGTGTPGFIASSIKSTPSESDFWFGASIRAHRRLKRGFDVAVGLQYAQAAYTDRLGDEIFLNQSSGASPNYVYTLEKARFRYVGASLSASYHLLQHKRLHPYFGMGLNALVSQQEREFLGQVYVGEAGPEAFTTTPVNGLPVKNTSVNVDVVAIAGVLYRLNDRWSVGLEYSTISAVGAEQFGLQVRYAL